MILNCTDCSDEIILTMEVDALGRKPRVRRCKPCAVAAQRNQWRVWKSSNYERALSFERARYSADKEKFRAKTRKYHSENKEQQNQKASLYRAANLEERRYKDREWHALNITRDCMRNAERRAIHRKATPAWANKFFIEEAYSLARLRTKMLGFQWHVDHIVPMRNKLVCGLHVEHNLSVIPGVENSRKGNRHWPDMPNEIG